MDRLGSILTPYCEIPVNLKFREQVLTKMPLPLLPLLNTLPSRREVLGDIDW